MLINGFSTSTPSHSSQRRSESLSASSRYSCSLMRLTMAMMSASEWQPAVARTAGYRLSANSLFPSLPSCRLLLHRSVALHPVPGAISRDLEIEATSQCFQAVDANPGKPVRKGRRHAQRSTLRIRFQSEHGAHQQWCRTSGPCLRAATDRVRDGTVRGSVLVAWEPTVELRQPLIGKVLRRGE